MPLHLLLYAWNIGVSIKLTLLLSVHEERKVWFNGSVEFVLLFATKRSMNCRFVFFFEITINFFVVCYFCLFIHRKKKKIWSWSKRRCQCSQNIGASLKKLFLFFKGLFFHFILFFFFLIRLNFFGECKSQLYFICKCFRENAFFWGVFLPVKLLVFGRSSDQSTFMRFEKLSTRKRFSFSFSPRAKGWR